MAVTEDCNCPIPRGHVKAQRLRGSGSGSWGSASKGQWAILPRSIAEARPDLWMIQEPGAPESHAAASEELEGMTVADLTALAAQRGVQLPSKAREADIITALQGS